MTITSPSVEPVAEAGNIHRIVVVGGGAGGLELVTGLGDSLGKQGRADVALVEKARTHLWKPLLHEVAAGSMDVSRHELDYLAQALLARLPFPLRRDGRSRSGAGPRATRRQVRRGGARDHAVARDSLRHAGDRGRQRHQRFRHARRDGACDLPRHARAGRSASTGASSMPACARTPRRSRCGRASFTSPSSAPARPAPNLSAELHHTAARCGRLRARPDRSRQGHQHHPDRGGGPHPAGAARARSSDATQQSARQARRRRPHRRAGGRGRARTASGSPTAISSPPSSWSGRPACSGPDVLRDLDGLEVSASSQLVVRPTLQTTRDDDIFAIGDCAHLVPDGEKRPIPPRAQAAHQQASHLLKQIEAPPRRRAGAAVRLSRFRVAGVARRILDGRQPDGLPRRQGMFIEGYVARLMYRSLYKMHEAALHGPVKVGLDTRRPAAHAAHRAARQAALNDTPH